MLVVLLGYMASGKSMVGKILAKVLGYDFIDLDNYIEQQEGETITSIFKLKGEIYFRKKETKYLKEILTRRNNFVIALGGGTPCYADNMDLLKRESNCKTIYLKATIPTLIKRLENEKNKRPLVSHLNSKEELEDFIGKHVFERSQYYSKAEMTVDTNNRSIEKIVESIIFKLF